MGAKKHKKESKKKKHRSRSRSPLDAEEHERKRHKKHRDRKKNRSPDVEEVPLKLQVEPEAASRSRSRSAERDRRMREERHREREQERSREHEREQERPREREREQERPRERERELERPREREREQERPREREREQERPRERERELERSRERERDDRRQSEDRSEERERQAERSPPAAGGSNQESLSVEETNRLRVKLGLKPLEVAHKTPDENGKLKDDLGEFFHRPAANIAQQKKAEKLRERLQLRKDKRALETKLQTTLLADGSDDEDAVAWVNKSRDIAKQKAEAAKRAAMLDEMDAAFGVSALVADDERAERGARYTARQLKGLRVAHDMATLGEDRDVVLTLADKGVLADDDEDVLVNVNMVDNEKYLKNIAERKKARAGYQAYDDEAAIEAEAAGLPKSVLSKYDDEIDTTAAERAKGFVIGDEAAAEAKRFKQMMRDRMQTSVEKRLESLQMPAMRLASDYMDEDELNAKFKKVKKRGKIRKRVKEETIDVDDYDPNAVPLQTDDTDVKPELEGSSQLDEEEVEPDSELQTALARARRMRLAEAAATKVPKVEILHRVKEEAAVDAEATDSATIVLDATAEFCRTLGDIPTYGQAGNRDRRAEIMELEEAESMEADMEAQEEAAGAWSRVDLHSEKPPDIAAGSSVALDAEPALGAGVAGALQVALSKGYLERAEAAPAPRAGSARALIAAAHYSIEDKVYGEDDKHGRRERGYAGPLSDFREKSHFKPNIKLEYVDDDGRPLCPKEAFRYLSHKFHGKGPGKNKQEKRIKKAVQEGLMKKMSSTDTPLNTLALLQEKQKETHSPFIVLSGSKKDQPN